MNPALRLLIRSITVGFAGLMLCLSAAATPPPDALEEGFGVASAAQQAPTEPSEDKPSNADILEALLAESEEGVDESLAQECISRRDVRRFQILNNELLLVHGSKGRLWLNQFSYKCHGLRRQQALVIETRGVGTRYCRSDTVYGRDRGGFGGGFGSARCHFGKFQPISAEQAEMVKLAAKNARR